MFELLGQSRGRNKTGSRITICSAILPTRQSREPKRAPGKTTPVARLRSRVSSSTKRDAASEGSFHLSSKTCAGRRESGGRRLIAGARRNSVHQRRASLLPVRSYNAPARGQPYRGLLFTQRAAGVLLHCETVTGWTPRESHAACSLSYLPGARKRPQAARRSKDRHPRPMMSCRTSRW